MAVDDDTLTGTHTDALAGLDIDNLKRAQAFHLHLLALLQTLQDNGKELGGEAVSLALFQTVLVDQYPGYFLY